MPNLTSYHAPAIYLNRELPKTFCDLLQHEQNYSHFLRSYIANDRLKSNIDCHNESYKKQTNISHFRLRQNQWKNQVDCENQRFIHSLIYRLNQHRPTHDRYTALKAYREHLKLLESISQYSKYNLTNSICKTFIDKTRLNNRNLQFNDSQIKTKKSSRTSEYYLKNLVQQTVNKAIQIYCQPLPNAPIPDRSKSSNKPLERRQNLFQSFL